MQRLRAARELLFARRHHDRQRRENAAERRSSDRHTDRELIALCGGYNDGVVRLIAGGSMMGYALPDDDTPITKATNCIIAALADEVGRTPTSGRAFAAATARWCARHA